MNRPSQHLLLFATVLILASSLSAQDLPKEIRGYKVHKEIVTLSNDATADREKAFVKVGTPTIEDVSLGGVTLAIVGELEEAGHDGRVELMTFKDFRVNNLAIDVSDFDKPFDVKKSGRTTLPEPATVFLPTAKILNAAWKEITASKDDWTVTGRVFVFGKFKKFGFKFKRVIPVDVRLTIKNPLVEYRKDIVSSRSSK